MKKVRVSVMKEGEAERAVRRALERIVGDVDK